MVRSPPDGAKRNPGALGAAFKLYSFHGPRPTCPEHPIRSCRPLAALPGTRTHKTLTAQASLAVAVLKTDIKPVPRTQRGQADGFDDAKTLTQRLLSLFSPYLTCPSFVLGHKYLSIALELHQERIRAVLQGTTFEDLRRQGVPGVLSVVPQTRLESEQNTAVIAGWHVFFFKSTPSQEMADRIDARFRGFLNQSLPDALGSLHQVVIDSHFDFSGPCFEIKFPTPVANQAWANLYHAFISSVSNEVLPIATYQGRRFVT
jgi:hypothetical protein